MLLLAGLASVRGAAPAPPVITAVDPPGVARGGRERWVVRGERLGRVDRVEVEGSGVRAVVTRATDDALVVEAAAEPGAAPDFREVRVAGPHGISNPRLVRVDRLGQTAEREPNDTAGLATPLPAGTAGVGVLGERDVDHYRVAGVRGARVAIDLEARRLGAALAPVVTVFGPGGRPLVQRRETPGVDGDCRFAFTFPADGSYVVQVRDNLYGGTGGAPYRLRITPEPFATGLFPLGGPPGRAVTVTASGGTLPAPLRQTVRLPDNPGAVVDIPPFDGPDGPVLAPGRLVVGGGAERDEPGAQAGLEPPSPLTPGTTVNGRIGRAGEVDRYRLDPGSGLPLTLQVVAAPLGSWLDSVVTVRDPRGAVVAENDDSGDSPGGVPIGPNPDSRLTLPADTAGPLTVEVADRFGRGGPEFGYRLAVAPKVPDFRAWVNVATGADGSRDGPTPSGGVVALGPGAPGVLVAGVQVVPDARIGPITLRVEGLPEGVACDPAVVRRGNGGRGYENATLRLRVGPGVRPATGRLRVVATAAREDGSSWSRPAECTLVLAPGDPQGKWAPVERRVTWLPFWVYTGDTGP